MRFSSSLRLRASFWPLQTAQYRDREPRDKAEQRRSFLHDDLRPVCLLLRGQIVISSNRFTSLSTQTASLYSHNATANLLFHLGIAHVTCCMTRLATPYLVSFQQAIAPENPVGATRYLLSSLETLAYTLSLPEKPTSLTEQPLFLQYHNPSTW